MIDRLSDSIENISSEGSVIFFPESKYISKPDVHKEELFQPKIKLSDLPAKSFFQWRLRCQPIWIQCRWF